MGGPASGRRQSSTVANREPFRAVTTQTVGTESLVEETSPQEIPLVTMGLERNRLGQKKFLKCLPVTTGSDKNLPGVTPLYSPRPKKFLQCPSVTIGRDRSDVTPIFQPNHPQKSQKTRFTPP